MKRNSTLAIVLSALTALQAPAGAAISFTPQATAIPGSAPQGFSYQGRLESSGSPVNGPTLLVFRIFDAPAGGNLLWSSSGITAQVAIGLFNVVVPAPITALVGGGSRWLEVQINGTTMSPREQLNSVPYALVAKSVEGTIDVSTAGLAIMPNALATNPALIISSQTGNVGIGTTNPGAAFSVGSSSLVVTSGGNVGIGVSNPAGAFSVGASSLIVTSGGSVGINTASPAANLDVNGSAQFGAGAAKSTFTATGALVLASSYTLVGGYASLPAAPNVLAEGAGGAFPNAASVVFGSAGAGWLYHIGTQSAGVFSPILNVQDSGSVGVGTSGPLSKFDVAGSAAFGAYGGASAAPANGLVVSGAVGVGTPAPLSKLDVAGGAAHGAYAGVNPAPANGLIVSGSVGVGTPNPATLLHMSSGTLTIDGSAAKSLTTTGSAGIGTAGQLSRLDVAGNAAFGAYGGANAAPANGLIVSGQAGVGTAVPQSKFDVSGNAAFGTYGGVSAAPANGLIVSGAAGVGTTLPQSKFDVAGNVSLGAYGGASAAPANGLIVSGAAGVGTPAPLSKLDVSGGEAVGAYAGAVAAPANGLIVSGSVGIGASSPQTTLEVNGTAQFGSGVTKSTFSAAGGLTFTAGYNPSAAQDATTKNYVDNQLLSGGGPWTQKSPSIFPTTSANNVTVFSTVTVQGASFSVGASNLNVTAGGVGVGTAGQLSRLDVNGGAAVGAYAGANAAPANGLIVSGAAGVGTAGPLSKFDVAGNAALGAYGGVNAAPANGLIVSGAAGVGTAGPLSKFDVAGNAAFGAYGGVNAAPGNGLIVSGSVGVGTASPATTFDVNGSAQFGSTTKSTFTTSGDLNLGGNITVGNIGNSVVTLGGSPAAGGATGKIKLITSNTQTNWQVSNNTFVLGALEFTPSTVGGGSTFTTPAMVMNSSLNLGIGTSGPLSKLDVNGGIAAGTYAGVSAAPANSIIVSGNVGIGTAIPATKLHLSSGSILIDGNMAVGLQVGPGTNSGAMSNVYGNGGAALDWGNTSSLGRLTYIAGTPAVTTVGAIPIQFGSNNGADLNINASHNVGIGTAGQLSKLDVNGGVAVGAYAGVSAAPANGMIVSGNVGIGQNGAAVALDLAATTELGLGVFTTAQVQAKTPGRVGTLIYNSTLAQVCVSTGTTIQGYSRVATPGTTCQ